MLNVLITLCWTKFFSYYIRVCSPLILSQFQIHLNPQNFSHLYVILIDRIGGVLMLDVLITLC